jgi:hypothetical protein
MASEFYVDLSSHMLCFLESNKIHDDAPKDVSEIVKRYRGAQSETRHDPFKFRRESIGNR